MTGFEPGNTSLCLLKLINQNRRIPTLNSSGILIAAPNQYHVPMAAQAVKRLIKEERLGEIVDYECHFDRFVKGRSAKQWKRDGGRGINVLFDLGIHLIDQAYTLFGMPEEVYADMRKQREESRKSIFKNSRNSKRIKQAVKHNLRNRMLGIGRSLELLYQAQSKFSEHIQILLDGPIYNTAVIFRKMDVEKPVHGFHGPLHPGMMKQLQSSKLPAGDIVMPFCCFRPFPFKFCLD